MTLPQSNPAVVRTAVVDRAGAETPVVVEKMAWWQAIGVRVVRTYVQSLVGLIGAVFVLPAVLPEVVERSFVLMPYADRLIVTAQLAALPAVMSLLHNALDILAKWDATAPGYRA